MKREGSFDADATANLSHGYRFGDTTVLKSDNGSFEQLNTLFTGLSDLDMGSNGITGAQNGNFGFCASSDNAF
jgi:hypothetical protein